LQVLDTPLLFEASPRNPMNFRKNLTPPKIYIFATFKFLPWATKYTSRAQWSAVRPFNVIQGRN